MNKKLGLIIVIVLLVGIGIGAVMVLQSDNAKTSTLSNSKSVEDVVIPDTNTTVSESEMPGIENTNTASDDTRTISEYGLSWKQPIDWKTFSKEKDDNGEYFVFVGTSEAVNGVENKGVSVMITNTDIYFNYGTGPKLETTRSKENDLDISRTVYGDEVVKSIHYEVSGAGINNTVYIICMMGDKSFYTLGETQCELLVASITNDT